MRQWELLNDLEFSWIQKILEGFQEDNPGWIESKRVLKELSDICSQQNIRLLAAIYPMLVGGIDPVKRKQVHETIEGYFNALNVPAIDLLPVFDGKPAQKFRINFMDNHPNTTV